MTAWTAGTEVGPYVLLAPIGAGGMGGLLTRRKQATGFSFYSSFIRFICQILACYQLYELDKPLRAALHW